MNMSRLCFASSCLEVEMRVVAAAQSLKGFGLDLSVRMAVTVHDLETDILSIPR